MLTSDATVQTIRTCNSLGLLRTKLIKTRISGANEDRRGKATLTSVAPKKPVTLVLVEMAGAHAGEDLWSPYVCKMTTVNAVIRFKT